MDRVPHDPNRMINGNDGERATISLDGGRDWTTQNNQPTAQFYHIVADNDFQYRVYGSQQDNSSVGIRTRSDHGFIDRPDWDFVGGGESGYIAVDPRDSNIVYGDDEGPISLVSIGAPIKRKAFRSGPKTRTVSPLRTANIDTRGQCRS